MKVLGNPWFATVVTLLPGLALAFWWLCQHLAALWCFQPAARRHDHDHPRRVLQVHRPQGLDALRARRLPALLHLHLAGPERHGLHDRRRAYGFFGTIPATATTAAVSVAATKGLQLVFAVLLMVPGLIVAVNCLKEFFGKEAGSMPDEERVVRYGQGRVRSRRCRRGSCRRRGRQGLVGRTG